MDTKPTSLSLRDPNKPWDTGDLRLPWTCSPVGSCGGRKFSGRIIGHYGTIIAEFFGTGRHNTEARMEYIVKAVRSHDDLVKAAKSALGQLTGNMDGDMELGDPVELLRVALAKVGQA